MFHLIKYFKVTCNKIQIKNKTLLVPLGKNPTWPLPTSIYLTLEKNVSPEFPSII